MSLIAFYIGGETRHARLSSLGLQTVDASAGLLAKVSIGIQILENLEVIAEKKDLEDLSRQVSKARELTSRAYPRLKESLNTAPSNFISDEYHSAYRDKIDGCSNLYVKDYAITEALGLDLVKCGYDLLDGNLIFFIHQDKTGLSEEKYNELYSILFDEDKNGKAPYIINSSDLSNHWLAMERLKSDVVNFYKDLKIDDISPKMVRKSKKDLEGALEIAKDLLSLPEDEPFLHSLTMSSLYGSLPYSQLDKSLFEQVKYPGSLNNESVNVIIRNKPRFWLDIEGSASKDPYPSFFDSIKFIQSKAHSTWYTFRPFGASGIHIYQSENTVDEDLQYIIDEDYIWRKISGFIYGLPKATITKLESKDKDLEWYEVTDFNLALNSIVTSVNVYISAKGDLRSAIWCKGVGRSYKEAKSNLNAITGHCRRMSRSTRIAPHGDK